MRFPPRFAPCESRSLSRWRWSSALAVRAPSRRVNDLIGNALQRRHFFDNLQNPAWIEPLREAGLFETPPGPIVDLAEGTVGSPPWPQSKYLARMAQFSPEAVQELNREANTTLSKSTDLVIKEAGLAIKAEVEKLREQVQNVE